MALDKQSFFDCKLIWTPRELEGPEPYVILVDEKSDPFAKQLIMACRGEAGYRGTINNASEAPSEGVVICEAPVWHRNYLTLRDKGVHGDRARVLFYFDQDPSGYWDFGKACGDSLSAIYSGGGVSAAMLPKVSDFIETWLGARPIQGRLSPAIKLATRDYRTQVQANADKVMRVFAALADDESRAVYARILFGNSEQIFAGFSQVVWGPQQYMEIANLKPGDVVLNCGVGRGWELPYFIAQMRGEGRIINFDPNIVYDSSQYRDFIQSFSGMVEDHGIILTDRDGTIDLPISFSNMVRSDTIAQEGDERSAYETYPCAMIDTLMDEGLATRIDYLKMDVEGGEIFILKGALKAIKKYRPKLAVAIYHEPNHFWDYPNFLMDNISDYRFYLRQYGYSRFETLLYAIPKEEVTSGSSHERLVNRAAARDLAFQATENPQIRLWYRDLPECERAYYAKSIRPLTGFTGREWQTAELTPMPQIEADEIVSVCQRPHETVLYTLHRYDPQTVRLTVARVKQDVDIDYIVDRGVSGDAVACPVWSDDGAYRVAIWTPSTKGIVVFRFDGQHLNDDVAMSSEVRPLVLDRRNGGWGAWVQRTSETTSFEALVGNPHGDSPAHGALPGKVVGVAEQLAYQNGAPRAEPLLLLQGADKAIRFARLDGSGVVPGALTWDSRIAPVSCG